MKRTLSDKKTSKNLSIKSETLSPQIGNNGNSASEKESLLTQDEYDFELQIEETPSFDNNKIDDNIINNDFNSHFFSPVLNENKLISQRKKILSPGFSLNDNIDNSDKKSNDFKIIRFIVNYLLIVLLIINQHILIILMNLMNAISKMQKKN